MNLAGSIISHNVKHFYFWQEGHDGPGSFPWVSCNVGLKGFYIIWPGDLVFNWVKVILAISVEDHPKIIPVKLFDNGLIV